MDLVDFRWWRCIDGYRLEQTKPSRWPTGDRVEISTAKAASYGLTSNSDNFGQYEPLKISGLYAIFAETPHNPEGMKAFCNRFGLLGGSRPDLVPLKGKSKSSGALVDELLRQHREFRHAFELYNRGNLNGVADYWNMGDWSAALRSELRVSQDGKIGMVISPPGLIQAIWLQFALKICADTKLLRCEHCGAPFEVGTGTGRRNSSKYCSDACKSAAFKKRKGNE